MGSGPDDLERIIYYAFWDTCGVVAGTGCWVLATITESPRPGPRKLEPGVQVLRRFGMRIGIAEDEAALRAASRQTGIPTAAWEYFDGQVVSGKALSIRRRGDNATNSYSLTHGTGW